MRRLDNDTIHIEPYDLCYCGSDKKVKFCCGLNDRGNIPRPVPSDCKPPSPQTGYSNPKCYAQKLNDCSHEMSGEHLFSESMLDLLTGEDGMLLRSGYPWQKEGEVQRLTPKNCKANVLCKRHNNALSPLDTTGKKFLKVILSTPDFLQNHTLRVIMLSGDDVERWILKTSCTHIVAVGKFGSDWEPPLQWLKILWEMHPFPPGYGLYFNHEIGETTPDTVQLRFRVLTSPNVVGPAGAIVELGAYKFALTMAPPNLDQQPNSALVTKYYRPSDFVITSGKSEVVFSFGWQAQVVPQRIGISWAPNSSSR